jgi:hypothetical protein
MLSLEELRVGLSGATNEIERKLHKSINQLQTESGELSQAEVIALQSQITAWSNLLNLISSILRAVGDAMKATVQNVR